MSNPTDRVPAGRPTIEQVLNENERLRLDLERAERERDRLRREVERLRGQLEAARRAGFRQAAPFSKGVRAAHPRRPGRRSGSAHGRHGQRPAPTLINDVQDVPVPPACPQCGGAVDDTHVTAQYQEDLPPVRPVVRRFDVHIGRCRRCGRRLQGRHPLQTSDAVGAAAVQLGPQALAVAGGFKDRAKRTHVTVFRRGPGGPEAVRVQEINAKRVLEGKQLVDDVRLEPGDLVFVSKTHIPNMATFTNTVLPNLGWLAYIFVRKP